MAAMTGSIVISSPTLTIGTLLLLAILLSLTFRLVTTTAASSLITHKNKQRLLVFHAFALECVQLTLVACGIHEMYTAAPTSGGTYMATARLLVHGTLYTAVVFAVDIIENLVVLGTVQHPVQTQTLVLTRKVLWPAFVSFVFRRCDQGRLPRLEGGGLAVYAKRGFGLQGVEMLFLVQRVRPRRKSVSCMEVWEDGWWKGPGMHEREKTTTATLMTRRHSFPDDQLNTRPILQDNRIERSSSPDGDSGSETLTYESRSERSVSQDRGAGVETPTHRPRGRVPSTVTQTSCDGSESSIGKVMARVGEIDRKGSRSRETSTKRQDHVAPRWRPAGGSVK